MSVRELSLLVPPPPNPLGVATGRTKEMVEKELGIVLPDELFDFASVFGSGTFGTSIGVYNPYSLKYVRNVDQVIRMYRELKRDEGDMFPPFDVFPENPGLFPWGYNLSGGFMFWLTNGLPNEWPTILFVDGESEMIDQPFTSFLTKLLRSEIDCLFWSKRWVAENKTLLAYQPMI